MYVERGNTVNNMYLERNMYRGDRYVVSLMKNIFFFVNYTQNSISGSVVLCGLHLSSHIKL